MTPNLKAVPPEWSLAQLRAEIDRIDAQLLALIAERLALAPEIAARKCGEPLFRPGRESALFARLGAEPVVRGVWTQLIAGMLAAQGVRAVLLTEERLRVAALLRFGAVIPMTVDPCALARAAEAEVIVVAPPGTEPPRGCARLCELPDHSGTLAAIVIGREEALS